LTEGVAQAKDYSGKLAVRYTYATNGQGFNGIDMQQGTGVAPDTRKKLLAGLTDSPLLRLKYHDSIADAVADLGDADRIGMLFTGFQRYLYQEASPT